MWKECFKNTPGEWSAKVNEVEKSFFDKIEGGIGFYKRSLDIYVLVVHSSKIRGLCST